MQYCDRSNDTTDYNTQQKQAKNPPQTKASHSNYKLFDVSTLLYPIACNLFRFI